MLQKTEMVRRGFVNLRTSCYRSSGGPVLLKKCHGRTDFRTGPKVHATLVHSFEKHKVNSEIYLAVEILVNRSWFTVLRNTKIVQRYT